MGKRIFDLIFCRKKIAAFIEGDAFHRRDWAAMKRKVAEEAAGNPNFTHFHVGANELEALEAVFAEYGKAGSRLFEELGPVDAARLSTIMAPDIPASRVFAAARRRRGPMQRRGRRDGTRPGAQSCLRSPRAIRKNTEEPHSWQDASSWRR